MSSSLAGLQPEKSTLYELAPDGRTLNFIFSKCDACEHLTFPFNAPGCQACGAIEGRRVIRPGTGVLKEAVTVYVPLAPGMEVPLQIGQVEIANSSIEEVVIKVDDESQLTPGMRMSAIAEVLPDGKTYGCRFVPVMETAV